MVGYKALNTILKFIQGVTFPQSSINAALQYTITSSQPSKASRLQTSGRDVCIRTTFVKLLQFSKALVAIEVTLEGIVISINPEQPSKAETLISSTPSAMVTSISLVQP